MAANNRWLSLFIPAASLAKGTSGPITPFAADADALEKLRRLCYSDEDVPPPVQMELT